MIEFDDDEEALITTRQYMSFFGSSEWASYERGMICYWWVNDARILVENTSGHGDNVKEFTHLAKKMKRQRLWWREAEDSEDSSGVTNEEQVDHTEERKEDTLP